MKQTVQTQHPVDTPSTDTLYLFIYPLLIPNGLIKIIVLPYLKNQQSKTITNNRDTDPSTQGMANPSGSNRLRTRTFKGKAISDCNSPAIASAYQHSDWKLWPQSDNPRGVRDALQYDSRDRLTQRGKLDYSYDDNGSLTSISHTDNGLQRSFIYNLENRLIQVKDGQGQSISSYQYDPFGRRISKTVGTVTTYYFYSAEGLVAEMSASGQITSQYGYRPDGTWGTNPLFIKQAGYTGYYQNDHLGTPQQIVSSSGQILWDASYSAFGLAVVTTNVVTNNLRLAGQYYDQETNLHYNYFRYYDPNIGRYVTSDPIGLRGGINTYGYVGGNPMYWIDPFGLFYGRGYAQSFMINNGHTYMTRNNDKVIPGTKSEGLRNAEHYLFAYTMTSENKLWAIPIIPATVIYGAYKSGRNFLEDIGLKDSPYTYTPPTIDEYSAGFEGVIDGLFGTNDVFLINPESCN